MTFVQRVALPILLATTVIAVSEFARNELLLKSRWVDHYQSLGLVFPSEPVNGVVWGLWSLLFAVLIFVLSRRYEVWQTTAIAWFAAFLLMWVVIGNMGVLPPGLLVFAVPLSLLETWLATLVVVVVSPPKRGPSHRFDDRDGGRQPSGYTVRGGDR